MNKILISYKSRNNLLALARILNSYGIPSATVNTPHSISVSCGLSLKVDYRYFPQIKNIIMTANLTGFLGVFLFERNGTTERVERIF